MKNKVILIAFSIVLILSAQSVITYRAGQAIDLSGASTVSVPTASIGDNTTKAASTAFVIANAGGTIPNTGANVPTVAAPTSGWTARNAGIVDDFLQSNIGVWFPGNATPNWNVATRTLPARPYTVIASINCSAQPNIAASSGAACGLYLYDGTKLEGIEVVNAGTTIEGVVRVQTFTVLSNPTQNNLSGNSAVNTTSSLGVVTLQIIDDNTHRTFYYWKNNSFTQFFQETSNTFLTPTSAGFGGSSQGGTGAPMAVILKYWCTVASATVTTASTCT